MTTSSLNDATLIAVNPEIVFGDIDGEIVALSMESGSYLHLNSSGSFIFGLLDESAPQTMAWLCRRVRQEYEVDEVTCRQELDEFMARCIGLDLLRVAAGAPA